MRRSGNPLRLPFYDKTETARVTATFFDFIFLGWKPNDSRHSLETSDDVMPSLASDLSHSLVIFGIFA